MELTYAYVYYEAIHIVSECTLGNYFFQDENIKIRLIFHLKAFTDGPHFILHVMN